MDPNKHATWIGPARRMAAVVAALLMGVGTFACRAESDLPVTGEGAKAVGEGVDAQVLSYLINNDLPGATLAVTRAGRLVWSKGYGFADQDGQKAMQPSHRSRIGSVSKILTTIGALQLVEEGALDLDMPLYGDPGAFVDSNTPWPPPDRSDWAWPSDTVLDTPGMYWSAMREGVEDLYHPNHVHAEMNKTREWASQVTVRHLLSHTSGLLRSGHNSQVEAHLGREVKDYRSAHLTILRGVIEEPEHAGGLQCFLDGELYEPKEIDDEPNPDYTGARHKLPPFGFAPGTDRCYSNHAFGLMGHIIGEVSDGRMYHAVGGYRDYIRAGVLDPLGLDRVVPNNTNLHHGVDAWPHGGELDPEEPSWFTSTGGWSASARDLARVMCGLDGASNHLRLLAPETVETMQAVQFPTGAPDQPLGWDWRADVDGGADLYKNGRTTGGTSIVMKFLPGRFGGAPDDEINVALAVNAGMGDEAITAATPLLRDIAGTVASAKISAGYDLFDPAYACVVEGPQVTILDPSDNASFRLGTEIHFEAEAYDSTGEPLPIEWEILGAGERVSQPHSADGRHSVFYDGMPEGKHLITATTMDSGGHEATDQITVEITYDPPEVSITSHDDGQTVWAGQQLQLAGQTTSGGLFALPDDQVWWEVRRGGTLVRQGDGHELTVPGNVMQPGTYRVTFAGHDGQSVADDEITLVAEEPPGGLPTIYLRRPLAGSVHTHVPGGASIDFVGAAVDFEGDAISGTRFRWTASRAGEVIVLCEGSNVPGSSGGGGFAAEKSCSSFTAKLAGHHYAGHTSYTIKLAVTDVDGNSDSRQTTIFIYTPPVS